jgi:hypothetical protein
MPASRLRQARPAVPQTLNPAVDIAKKMLSKEVGIKSAFGGIIKNQMSQNHE